MPLFCLLSPCFTPSCRSQAPLQFLPAPKGPPRTRCARPKPQPPRSARPPRCAPSAAAPLRCRPPPLRSAGSAAPQGRPSRVAARRPATPAAPTAAAGDSGVPPRRHSLFVWPPIAARGGGRPGYRRAHVAPMALRTRSAIAPLAPPPPLAG